MKYIEKKFNLQLFFSSHCFMNIYPRLRYHALPAFLKRLALKNNCMCNRDNAHDADILTDEKLTKRSEQQTKQKLRQTSQKILKLI